MSLISKGIHQQASIFRYAARDRGLGSVVDLRCVPGLWPGLLGAGTVHHVAFRAESAAAQLATRNELVAKGHNVSPQMDRDYSKLYCPTSAFPWRFQVRTPDMLARAGQVLSSVAISLFDSNFQ